jgi:hypothetical protein
MARLRGYPAAFGALLVIGGLASLPWLTSANVTPPWAVSAQKTAPVELPAVAAPLQAVSLSSVAEPVLPANAPAPAPSGDSTHMAALVAAEDTRLRLLLHQASRSVGDTVVPLVGALPTLILRANPQGYTIADLEAAGAATPLSDGSGYLLVDSVLVAPGANLTLGGNGMSTLLMSSGKSGFTSIVDWGGTLTLTGDPITNAPFSIVGWNIDSRQPASNGNTGRPYIRDVGGKMDMSNVQVSNLGFWSGRTGGVAWTGISSQDASGGAIHSTFTGDTYGAFVDRGSAVTFTGDRFEANQLDGLRLNRYSNNITVSSSSSVRNGGNGFVVGKGAANDVLTGDVALHNAGNGFLLDGRPLVSGASPSGSSSVASSGTVVAKSEAEGNLRSGIVVEGGVGTVVQGNSVSEPTSGIEVRDGASNTWVVGNYVFGGSRVALSVGPGVVGTTINGNTLDQSRIGVIVQASPGVRFMDNVLTRMSIFGISVRGASPGVVGNDNSISGFGLNAVDTRAGAPSVDLVRTSTQDWFRRSQPTVLDYFRYHPMLTAWAAMILIIAFWWMVAHLRRRPALPYKHTVIWEPAAPAPVAPTALALTGHAFGLARQAAWAANGDSHGALVASGSEGWSSHGQLGVAILDDDPS